MKKSNSHGKIIPNFTLYQSLKCLPIPPFWHFIELFFFTMQRYKFYFQNPNLLIFF